MRNVYLLLTLVAVNNWRRLQCCKHNKVTCIGPMILFKTKVSGYSQRVFYLYLAREVQWLTLYICRHYIISYVWPRSYNYLLFIYWHMTTLRYLLIGLVDWSVIMQTASVLIRSCSANTYVHWMQAFVGQINTDGIIRTRWEGRVYILVCAAQTNQPCRHSECCCLLFILFLPVLNACTGLFTVPSCPRDYCSSDVYKHAFCVILSCRNLNSILLTKKYSNITSTIK